MSYIYKGGLEKVSYLSYYNMGNQSQTISKLENFKIPLSGLGFKFQNYRFLTVPMRRRGVHKETDIQENILGTQKTYFSYLIPRRQRSMLDYISLQRGTLMLCAKRLKVWKTVLPQMEQKYLVKYHIITLVEKQSNVCNTALLIKKGFLFLKMFLFIC